MDTSQLIIDSRKLRQLFLEFFKEKNHTIISPASLIPEHDPTVLFTTAGMHPLVPYLLGEKHPAGSRVANCQPCIRTGDIDEVGDISHLTFFEMLGNWSFGDFASPDGIGQAGYFKQEAIVWSWEFLTSPRWLGINPDRLAVSCFKGDQEMGVGRDDESFDLWRQVGVNQDKIVFLGRDENWWGPAGLTGPCGPDTEIFYYVGHNDPAKSNPLLEPKLWVEIWNNVFMQYNKNDQGEYQSLAQKNVDTGMGLERTVAVLNWAQTGGDIYKTDSLWPLVLLVEKLSQKRYGESDQVTRAMRVVVDHIKAAVFIIGDPRGVVPSNIGQGYVVRRLIRRAIRSARTLGINDPFVTSLAKEVIKQYQDVYFYLQERQEHIFKVLIEEEEKFSKTLTAGLKQFTRLVQTHSGDQLTGEEVFDLYQTYGFPIELTQELAHEHNLGVDMEGFAVELGKHQELSRTATAGQFKGGLADNSEIVKRYHTATHLLHQALRNILGDHVEQRGSNITAERLRFDFSHGAKMTNEEITQVQEIVNSKITEALPVSCEEMTVEQAKQAGAIGLFGHKYGEQVKVYSVGDPHSSFSREICGGPHVDNTSELGHFKIIKEEAVSQGVRRIKAILD